MRNLFRKAAGADRLNLLILLPVPILMLLANTTISMSNAYGCDSWTYFGMFHRYGKIMRSALTTPGGPLRRLEPGNQYMTSRVPAILPSYAVYQVVPLRYRRAVKFLLFFYPFMFAVYFLLRTYTRPRTAVGTTLVFSVTPIAAGIYSSDVMTGPTILYMTVAMLCSLRAIRSKYRALWHLASGMMYAAAAHSQPTALVFAFMAPVVYLYARFRALGMKFAYFMDAFKALALNLLGMVLLTALVQVVFTYYFRGHGFFWSAQFDFLGFISGTRINWLKSWSENVRILPIIPIVAIMLTFSLVRFGYFLGRLSPKKREVSIFFFGMILFQLLLALGGWYFLHFDTYNLYLIPTICLFAGTFIVSRLSVHRRLFRVSMVVLFILALCLLSIRKMAPSGNMHVLTIVLVGLFALFSIFLYKFKRTFALGLVLLLGLVMASVKPAYEFHDPWKINPRGYLRHKFETVEKLSTFIDKQVPHRIPKIWSSAAFGKTHLTGLSAALQRSYGGCPDASYGYAYPDVKAKDFRVGDAVIIFKRITEDLNVARRNLRKHGLDIKPGEKLYSEFRSLGYMLIHSEVIRYHKQRKHGRVHEQ